MARSAWFCLERAVDRSALRQSYLLGSPAEGAPLAAGEWLASVKLVRGAGC